MLNEFPNGIAKIVWGKLKIIYVVHLSLKMIDKVYC